METNHRFEVRLVDLHTDTEVITTRPTLADAIDFADRSTRSITPIAATIIDLATGEVVDW